MNIGKAIKLCRNRKGLTQAQLAELSAVSTSHLSMIEKGTRDPSLSTVNNISHALGIPVSVLTFLAADPEELAGIERDLAEKLSLAALELISK